MLRFAWVLITICVVFGMGSSGGIYAQSATPGQSGILALRGTVRMDGESKLEGADIWLAVDPLDNDPDGLLPGFESSDFLHTLTDAEGGFNIGLTDPWLQLLSDENKEGFTEDDFATVWIHFDGNVYPVRFSPVDNMKDEHVLDVDFPSDNDVLRFRIVDPAGMPLPGVVVYPAGFVSVYPMMPPGLKEKLKTISDDDGIVSYRNLTAFSFHSLEVNSRSHGLQHVPVNKRYEQVGVFDVKLRRVGSLSGKVVDSENQPVEGVAMTVLTMTGPDDHLGLAQTFSAADGTYEIPAIAVGEAMIVPGLDDLRNCGFSASVIVEADNDTVAEVVCQPQDFEIRGSVVHATTGEPIPGVKMKVTFGRFPSQRKQFESGEDGSFSVSILKGDSYIEFESFPSPLVYVGDDNSIQVFAQPGQQPDPLSIKLYSETTIHGTILDKEGEPVVNSTIYATCGRRHYGFAETQAGGKFILRVPQGIDLDGFEVWHGKTNLMKTVVENEDPLVLKLVDLFSGSQ